MKPDEVLTAAREAMTVKRVFSDPYEKNGVTVITAAWILGGAGAGGGEAPGGQGQGSGGGFGMNARPMGAFVIKGNEVSWQPAIDINQIVAALAVLTLRVVIRIWAKR